jgi:uncharacterized delta-60 repeat protein
MRERSRCPLAAGIMLALGIYFGFGMAPRASAQLTLNPTFNAGVTDGNSTANTSAVQADGKILVGGSFAFVNGVERFGLARLNSNGTTDATFNPGGAGPNGTIFDIRLIAGGKIIIGGSFTTYNGTPISGLARLNADGTLDATFNVGGTGTVGTVQTVLPQPDGKYLISGSGLSSYNGTAKFSVIRVNSDGTLDAGFTSPFATAVFVEMPGLQSDGKIIIGGSFSISGFVNVARLNTNGSLDNTFSVGGAGPNGGVYAIHVLPDNRILVGGDFTTFNGVPKPGGVRLNANGSVDNTFNPFPLDLSIVEYIAVRSNGQYLVVGAFVDDEDGRYPVGLVNTDGSPDLLFNPPQADNIGYHVNLQPDGKILVSGYFNNTEALGNLSNRNLIRLNADGTRDGSFQVSLSAFGSVGAMLQQPDGKYVVAGNFTFANASAHQHIARFNADGTIDNTFQSGYGLWGVGGVSANAVARQADGKILLGGNFWVYNLDTSRSLVRLNADGSRDASFTPLGIQAGTNPNVNDLLVLPDGKIMVAGSGLDLGNQTLVRLNTNGMGDAGFANGNGNGNMQKVIRQPDGKLIVVGNFTTYAGQSRSRIVRLNENGSLDGTFNIGTGANNQISTAELLPDGKILIAGFFTTFNGTTRNRIARLNGDGSLDATFAPVSGANGSIGAIAVQPDGKIVIAGGFTTFDGSTRIRLARLNANGTLDTTADSGIVNNFRFSVRRLMLTADNEILVGGQFATYTGVNRASIAKLSFAAPEQNEAPFDFDGDGKTDIGIFRPTGAEWWINRSSNGSTFAAQFGTSTDRIVPADYTGDGKADIAVWRPSDGNWFVLRSEDFSFYAFPFGTNGDLPAPADYDNDGIADPAVFRPSNGVWFIMRSSGGTHIEQFGSNGDVPVAADYDNDGKADLAIFRTSLGQWWINRSTAGVIAVTFGNSADKPTPGDFTGDGKADIALWRPADGNWFVLRSEDFSFYAFPFGTVGDIPAPGDYDGDGKFDATVFRPSNSVWFSERSTAGTLILQFGSAGDMPVPNAFVP